MADQAVRQTSSRRSGKSPEAFRTISEVATELDVPQHVLRFWESKFSQIRPMKRGGGRRFYRPEDVDLLRSIRTLLYDHGYTIKGVQKRLKDQGAKVVIESIKADADATDTPASPAAPAMAAEDAGSATQGGSSASREELLALLNDLQRMRDQLRDYFR